MVKGGKLLRTRRSSSESEKRIQEMFMGKKDIGIFIDRVPGKGLGVVALQHFFSQDIICEYVGEKISLEESRFRLSNLTKEQGSYILDVERRGRKSFSIDATKNNGRMGRFVNHSCKPNSKVETRLYNEEIRVVLVAKQTIGIGDEITYDYRDRSKEAIKANPWLANA